MNKVGSNTVIAGFYNRASRGARFRANKFYGRVLELVYGMLKNGELNQFRYRQYKRNLLKTLSWSAGDQRVMKAAEGVLAECGDRPIIIYPSVITWSHYLFQRPHQIFKEIAGRGVNVFFCTPDPRTDNVRGIKKLSSNLYLCQSVKWLVPLKNKPVWVWVGWTASSSIIPYFENAYKLYELIDELELFAFYCDEMKRDHLRLVETSDVVLASADRLLESIKPFRQDVHLVCNGVAVDDFSPEKEQEVPRDMRQIMSRNKPVVGYYGAISPWLDYDLIAGAAQAREDIEFVFIGPDYEGAAVNLPDLRNVHWLGPKRYRDLKLYLSCFTVATIPFKMDKVTHAVSPLKLFEYMAGGKPVLARDLEEIAKYPHVFRAGTVVQWVEKIGEAVTLSSKPGITEELRRVAEENSWARKVDLIMNAMGTVDGRMKK